MKRMACLCALIAVGSMHASVAGAQDTTPACHRCRDLEVTLPIFFTPAVTLDGPHGSQADLDGGVGVGMGIGYNFNAHVLLTGLFTWSARHYDATVIQEDGAPSTYLGSMYTADLSLHATYYLLDHAITPFVTAGIGIAGIDTDIPTGVSQSYCYWDPWWGYVCGTYEETKTENDLSLNAGLGIRWDINKDISVQGSYNKLWIDRESGSGGMLDSDLVKFKIIFRTKIGEEAARIPGR